MPNTQVQKELDQTKTHLSEMQNVVNVKNQIIEKLELKNLQEQEKLQGRCKNIFLR